jgi:hypothetical protein
MTKQCPLQINVGVNILKKLLLASVSTLAMMPALADTVTLPAGSVITLPNDLVVQVPAKPPANASVTLAATPSSVTVGQSFKLTWTNTGIAANANCTASGAWTGTKPPTNPTGVSLTPSAAGNSTYSLACPITGGKTVTGSVAVKVNAAPPPPPTGLSPDGSILEKGSSGFLVTPIGTWTFGAPAEPGMWDILLNGAVIGRGAKMEVAQGGKLFAIGSNNGWWTVTASGWTPASDPNVEPPPPPPPPTPTPAGNVMPITNVSGALVPKYPFQFGRPFVCGDIAHYPQVIFNGTPLQTQADVKNRCPDGSVKYAVIATVLPSLPDRVTQNLTFQDQASGNNTPITTANLLAQFPDFDSVTQLTKPASITGTFESDYSKWQAITNGSLSITVDGTVYNLTGLDLSTQPNFAYAYEYIILPALQAKQVPVTFALSTTQTFVSGGKTISLGVPATGQDIGPLLFKSGVSTAGPSAPVSASARKMLEDGNCKPWTSGPVAQTMICADRSAARVYDLDPTGNKWRPFHPEFVVTFWPATKQVFVRYVGEISNSMALEAFTADIKLTAGKAAPQSVFEQTALPHSIVTRWTHREWIGGAPEQKVNIDWNVGYLADTKYLPNFDRTLRIPEDVLTENWDRFNSRPHTKFHDPGDWFMYEPNVGYHSDIGHMPLWYNRALFSGGDWRAREVMFGHSDLEGAFGRYLREGDPTKKADRAQTVPAIGMAMSVYGRPTSWLFDDRVTPSAADAIVVHSPPGPQGGVDLYNWSDFTADTAHRPDANFVPYMLTGDPYYLDGLEMDNGFLSYGPGPGYRNGPYSVIRDQGRGEAWTLRTRLHAALAAPDDDPIKAIVNSELDDAFGYWEGIRAIKGTKYENTPIYKFGASLATDWWQGLGAPPLGWWTFLGEGYGGGGWDCQSSAASTVVYDTSVCWSLNAGWQQNFLIIELGRAVELGYAADKLFASAGSNIIGQLATDGYNSRMIGLYNIPDSKRDPASPTGYSYFKSWKDVMTAWSVSYRDSTEIWYWPATGREIYWDVARGAAGMASSLPAAGGLPSGMVAWESLNNLIAKQTALTGQAPNWNLDPTWAIVPRVK